jgi:hypothetical protein
VNTKRQREDEHSLRDLCWCHEPNLAGALIGRQQVFR